MVLNERNARLSDYGQVLLDVALQFGETLDLEQLLPLVLGRASTLLNADRALFALFDPEGRIERAVCHNFESTDGTLPVSQTLIGEVRRTGAPITIADAAKTEYHDSNSVQILGLRFMMAVPIPSRGRVIGVLYLDSQASKATNLDHETEFIVALSRLVGAAVENARLFRQQRYRNRLLGAMVHDFRTPLSVILANAELLARPQNDEDRKAMAEDIAACARRMSYMVANTLELAQADAGTRQTMPIEVDLGQVVPRHVRGLDIVAQPLELELVVETPDTLPLIRTVPERIWIILDNLLFNALKHARTGSTIRVAVTLRDTAGPDDALDRPREGIDLFSRLEPLLAVESTGFVEIAIHNEGPPIPADLLPHLFEAYTTGPAGRPGQPRSTGLGLSIVDQCVHHLGGRVWARSSADEGTTFAFSLPIDVRVGHVATAPVFQPMRHDTLPVQTLAPEDIEAIERSIFGASSKPDRTDAEALTDVIKPIDASGR